MGTGRLETFSDGVIAIIITIMVLELRVPEGSDLAAVKRLIPVFPSYVLSFVYIGTVLYGVVLAPAAIAYFILARTFIAVHGKTSALARIRP